MGMRKVSGAKMNTVPLDISTKGKQNSNTGPNALPKLVPLFPPLRSAYLRLPNCNQGCGPKGSSHEMW